MKEKEKLQKDDSTSNKQKSGVADSVANNETVMKVQRDFFLS